RPEARLQVLHAQMTSNARHGLPPRLMAHQPTRFTAAQESKPSPSPGIRMIRCAAAITRSLDSWNVELLEGRSLDERVLGPVRLLGKKRARQAERRPSGPVQAGN